MASYIAQSALTSFILEIVQMHQPGIEALVLDFADSTALRILRISRATTR